MSENINNKIDETLKGLRSPFNDKEASWNSISQKIDFNGSDKGMVFTLGPLLKIAAIVAIVAGLVWVALPSQNEFTAVTLSGQTRALVLPDGSEVTLNAESRISYDSDSFSENRQLDLSGEAFFKVKKGSSFTVNSSEGSITVLGTSFDVMSRDETFMVQCETGKVKVIRGDDSVILTPGHEVWNDGEALSEISESDHSIQWMDGRFIFSERPLKEVLNEIERQFSVSILWDDTETSLFTGEFDRNELSMALDVVCNTMGLDYEMDIEGKEIIITSK